jgi:hypothetical protein
MPSGQVVINVNWEEKFQVNNLNFCDSATDIFTEKKKCHVELK